MQDHYSVRYHCKNSFFNVLGQKFDLNQSSAAATKRLSTIGQILKGAFRRDKQSKLASAVRPRLWALTLARERCAAVPMKVRIWPMILVPLQSTFDRDHWSAVEIIGTQALGTKMQ